MLMVYWYGHRHCSTGARIVAQLCLLVAVLCIAAVGVVVATPAEPFCTLDAQPSDSCISTLNDRPQQSALATDAAAPFWPPIPVLPNYSAHSPLQRSRLVRRDDHIDGSFPASQQLKMDPSTAAFSTSLILNFAVGAILYVVFSVVRPWNISYYAPRMIAKNVRTPRSITGRYLGWILATLKTPDRELLRDAGLDAYMFLRFLRLSRRLFLIFCLIGLPVMLPLNIMGSEHLDGVQRWTVANVMGQAPFWGHVVCSYLFAAITVYFIVRELNVFIRLRHAYLTSPAYRRRPEATTMLLTGLPKKIQFDQERRLRQLYGRVPGGLRSVLTVRRSVRVGLAKSRRDQVHQQLELAVCRYVATGKRPQVKQKRWWRCTPPPPPSATDLEMTTATGTASSNAVDKNPSRPDTIDESKHPKLADSPDQLAVPYDMENVHEEPADSLRFSTDELAHTATTLSLTDPVIVQDADGLPLDPSTDLILHLALSLRQQEADLGRIRQHASNRVSRLHIASTAFLRFRTQLGTQLAAQAVAFRSPLVGWPRFVGVRAEDVIWRNLRVWGWERWVRKAVSFAAAFFLTIFWAALVTVISSVATLSSLTTIFPVLAPLANLPSAAFGFIQGVVPQLIIFMLLGFVPYLLYFLAIFEGIPLYSRVYLSLMQKYFIFMLINILLVCTFATGIFTALASLIDRPSLALSILAKSMPSASVFFINYILLLALFGSVKELLRIPTLLLRWFKRPFISMNTPRKLLQNRRLPEMEWGRVYPNATLIFSIGYVYSTISPVILPFTVLYFTLHHVVFRYQFLYVYATQRGSAARPFPKAISQMFIGLYIQQLTLLGIVILHKNITQAVFIGLLFTFALTAHVFLNKGFGMSAGGGGKSGLTEFVPLEMLSDIEEQERRGLRPPELPLRMRLHQAGSVAFEDGDFAHGSQLSSTVVDRGNSLDIAANEEGIPIKLFGVTAGMDPTTNTEMRELIGVFFEARPGKQHGHRPAAMGEQRGEVSRAPRTDNGEPATSPTTARTPRHRHAQLTVPPTNGDGHTLPSESEVQSLSPGRLQQLEATVDTSKTLPSAVAAVADQESRLSLEDDVSENEDEADEAEAEEAEADDRAEMTMILEGEMGEWDCTARDTMEDELVSMKSVVKRSTSRSRATMPSVLASSGSQEAIAEAVFDSPLNNSNDVYTANNLASEVSARLEALSKSDKQASAADATAESDTVDVDYGSFPHAGTIVVETTTVSRAPTTRIAPRRSVAVESPGLSTQSFTVTVPGRAAPPSAPASSDVSEPPQLTITVPPTDHPRPASAHNFFRPSLTPQPPHRLSHDAPRPAATEGAHHGWQRVSQAPDEVPVPTSARSPRISLPEMVPDGEEALSEQYVRPRFRRRPPVVWVPRDEEGRAERECQRLRALSIAATCHDAALCRKGRRQFIRVDRADVPMATLATTLYDHT